MDAAEAIGKGVCISVAILDPASGALLAQEQVHVSGDAASSVAVRCKDALGAATQACTSTAGTIVSSALAGSPCCRALGTLSDECLDAMLDQATDRGQVEQL